MAAYQLMDPQSVLDFQHDWSDFLAVGDTISSRLWSISPTGPALRDEATSIVFVSGVTAGAVYQLTEHIITAAGVEADRTIALRCESR